MDKVYSRWHKILDAWQRRSISVPKDFRDEDLNLGELELRVAAFSEAPHFVIHRDLADMIIQDPNIRKSVCDMKKADSINFPFESQVVQIPMYTNLVKEGGEISKTNMITTSFVLITCNQERKEIIASVLYLDPRKDSIISGYREGLINIPEDHEENIIWASRRSPVFKCDVPQYRGTNNDQAAVWSALVCLLILTHTDGVEREVITCHKLNRARKKSGKSLIPDVVYLRIGRVYRSDGTAVKYDDRKPQRVHWRRGHNRRVAVGKGRSEREWRYIKPCLVNYIDGEEMPKPKTHVVKW